MEAERVEEGEGAQVDSAGHELPLGFVPAKRANRFSARRKTVGSTATIDHEAASRHKLLVNKFSTPKHSIGMPRRASQTFDDYNQSTSVAAFSMLSRRRRNQVTLDRIEDPKTKMKAHLRRLERDITDNVHAHHRQGSPSPGQLRRRLVTPSKLLRIEESYKKMGAGLDKIEQNAFWNKTNTKEASARIREFLLKRKQRLVDF
jgi:hypothetical protein